MGLTNELPAMLDNEQKKKKNYSNTTNTGGVKTQVDFWDVKNSNPYRCFLPLGFENFGGNSHSLPQCYLTLFPHIFHVDYHNIIRGKN